MTVTETLSSVAPAKPRGRWGDRILFLYTWAVIVWLCLPIGVMIVFGFNRVHGRYNNKWHGFTLKWYQHVFQLQDLTTALKNSLLIGLVATVIATILGTLIGLALGKYRFRGQGATNLVQFAAISSPEIVMGSSLVALFVELNFSLGFTTIVIAHVMFSLSFVAVTVRSRVLTLDPAIEEAAKDLGAGAFTTFRLVTLPMIMPGVISGALLAFALSIDDFVITNFTAGSTLTFPLWIWSAQKNGIPPQVNVMGTFIFAAGLVFAAASAIVVRKRDV
jgi:spermidine/putrescine transport system permease protein